MWKSGGILKNDKVINRLPTTYMSTNPALSRSASIVKIHIKETVSGLNSYCHSLRVLSFASLASGEQEVTQRKRHHVISFPVEAILRCGHFQSSNAQQIKISESFNSRGLIKVL